MNDRAELLREAPGLYRTPSGRYEITLDPHYETECDGPHPVRMRLDSLDRYSDSYKRSMLARGTIKHGKTGTAYLTYLCEGNESHFYARWVVWDNEKGDYPNGTSPDGFDTLAEAWEFLSDLLKAVHQ